MNTNRHIPLPVAGPDCAAFAPLLPLAGQRLLDEREAARLQEHVAGCAYCQALLAAYDRLDAALVRRFEGQTQGMEGLTEAIMDHIEDQQNPLPPPPITAPPAPLPTPVRGRHGFVTSLGAVAAVLAIAVVTAALFAGRGPHGAIGPGGRIPPFPTPTPPGPQLSVGDIAMVSPNDGWAFAQYTTAACFLPPPPSAFPSPGTPFTPVPIPGCKTTNLVLHYDGQTWRYAGAVDFEYETTLTMTSASEGWALASDAISHRTEVVHYSGGHWFVDSKYAFPGNLQAQEGLAMVSANEGWTLSFENLAGSPPALLHYTQGRWVLVHLPGIPSEGQLHSISMLNANEGWAVGWTDDPTYGPVLILHYHNGAWTKLNVAFPGSLNSVYTVSPDEAWAVGEENPSVGPGLILHYKAGKWTKVTGLQLNILHAVTMVSPTEGWVVGDGAMFLHYDNGIWSQVGLPIHHFAVGSISMGSATDGWATGGGEDSTGSGYSILFHYTGGEWTPYPLDALMSQLGKG